MAWAMRAWLLTGTLALVALAGCSKAPPPASTSDPFAGLTDEVAVTQTRGAIAGVVVDEAIRPVVGANVTLVDAKRTVQTDANGRFAFEELEPGVHFLAADAYRFEKAQVSADVVAGEPTAVRILLMRLTGAVPYHNVMAFRGHLENYLGFANFAVEVLQPGLLPCICSFDIPVDANLTTIVLEANGQVTVPNPGTPATVPGDAYWEVMQNGTNGALMGSAYSEFPIYETFDGKETLEGSPLLGVRVTCGVWPCYSADYDLFVTLWYHEEAPDGWSFLQGDT